MRIVVLSGSFNPITKAHFKILSDAVEFIHADKGIFITVSEKYLKKKIILKNNENRPFILSDDFRKEMIESLTLENPKLEFGGFEIGGSSPETYKTLIKMMKKYNASELFYLCGADKLDSLSHWKNSDDLFKNINIICYKRNDIDTDNIINNDPLLKENKDKILIYNTSSDIDKISSSELRYRFFNNIDYKDLMNETPYTIMKGLSPMDFNNITTEEKIKITLEEGGRFSENAARILVYKENLKLFTKWDTSLFGDKNAFLNGTKVYKNEFKVESNNNYDTVFNCVNDDSVNVGESLVNNGYNPAILNLASNKSPGGGYHKGTSAQEESLCQASNLSISLYQFGNLKYKHIRSANVRNIENVYPMDINFGGIYTKEVCFFRNNISKYFSLKDKPFKCSVITVSSLSNRIVNEYTNDESKYFNSDGTLNKTGYEIERNKIRTIYRIALKNNHDSLVLGAFGCGVYNLLPEQISKLFLDVLNEEEFKNKFKKIVFAILEKKTRNKIVGENGKFKPFYDLFK